MLTSTLCSSVIDDGSRRFGCVFAQVVFEVAMRRVLDNNAIQSILNAATANADETNQLRMLQTNQSRQFTPKLRPTETLLVLYNLYTWGHSNVILYRANILWKTPPCLKHAML